MHRRKCSRNKQPTLAPLPAGQRKDEKSTKGKKESTTGLSTASAGRHMCTTAVSTTVMSNKTSKLAAVCDQYESFARRGGG